MFGFLKRWRRRRIASRHAIPDAAWYDALAAAPVLARLDPAALARLRALTLLFLHEKRFVPVRGLTLTEPMRVRIAALACLLVLELGLDAYDDFVSVIVYPGEFLVRDREHVDDHGVVHVGDDVLAGEAWENGPVVLSWADVEQSGLGDGFNVVAHEFAHQLDGLDGAVNGVPPLHRGMDRAAWAAEFQHAFDAHCAAIDEGDEPWLDAYAAESPAEFFAVCVEMFFEMPAAFHRHHPALYAQLAAFFRQNPR